MTPTSYNVVGRLANICKAECSQIKTFSLKNEQYSGDISLIQTDIPR